MTASPLVSAILRRLREAGYDDIQTPFRVAEVEFRFTAAMRGRRGRGRDLLLLVDTTAGDFGDSDASRVRDRVQALSRALDVTGSRYVVTTILAGAALAAEVDRLAETCRVLHVDVLPLDKGGAVMTSRLDDRIRVLLPLSIPERTSDEQDASASERLRRALPRSVDETTLHAIMAASDHGEDAVSAAIGEIIDEALEGGKEEGT